MFWFCSIGLELLFTWFWTIWALLSWFIWLTVFELFNWTVWTSSNKSLTGIKLDASFAWLGCCGWLLFVWPSSVEACITGSTICWVTWTGCSVVFVFTWVFISVVWLIAFIWSVFATGSTIPSG